MKFENSEVFNIGGAFRGMRNPLQSWEKSDTDREGEADATIGPKDMGLAKRLARAGGAHAKFLRQIFVSVDITAPLYWWKEMDQYKVGTVTDSESTMHTLASTPITRERFEIAAMPDRQDDLDLQLAWDDLLEKLEALRLRRAEAGDRDAWLALVQMLPCAWLQKRTWTANYAVLRNICIQRRGHRLPEWGEFVTWAGSLPHAKELVLEGGG